MNSSVNNTLYITEQVQRERYAKAGQAHVFRYFSELHDVEKETLLNQLSSIDVESLADQVASAKKSQIHSANDVVSPYTGTQGTSSNVVTESSSSSSSSFYNIGLDAIASNEVCVVILAGGQGTRLGYDGPKGMYSIGLPSNKSLFQLIAERIQKLQQLAAAASKTTFVGSDGVVIPCYIMTSPMNDRPTAEYFERNNYFGLDKSNVKFFTQGVLPCLDTNDKIILQSKFECAMAPDGNGGIYTAIQSCGILNELQTVRRTIQYVHVFSIDNALVRPADPSFLGYCIATNADCGNKVVWKSNAHEQVGVMAQRNGRPCILEYSDVDSATVEQVDPLTGKLLYGAGNICNHFFTVDFLQTVVLPNMNAMYHMAHKKIPFYDSEVYDTVTPLSNNGIKLESFIFDVFPLSTRMAVYEVPRGEEFAPVKNAIGSPTDSPDTARHMISTLAKHWAVRAGAVLLHNDEPNICEISPLVSYAGEGLGGEDGLLSKIGKVLVCPFQLELDKK